MSYNRDKETKQNIINNATYVFSEMYSESVSENISQLHNDIKQYVSGGQDIIDKVAQKKREAIYSEYVQELLMSGKLIGFLEARKKYYENNKNLQNKIENIIKETGDFNNRKSEWEESPFNNKFIKPIAGVTGVAAAVIAVLAALGISEEK